MTVANLSLQVVHTSCPYKLSLPLWVTQCLSLPSLEVGNLSRVFHLTCNQCLLSVPCNSMCVSNGNVSFIILKMCDKIFLHKEEDLLPFAYLMSLATNIENHRSWQRKSLSKWLSECISQLTSHKLIGHYQERRWGLKWSLRPRT